MKTIENLNITSLNIRNKTEVMGSTKSYCKRLNLSLDNELNIKLQGIAETLNVNATEIIRQIISVIIGECEEIINENNY
jgi:hypothetical protein